MKIVNFTSLDADGNTAYGVNLPISLFNNGAYFRGVTLAELSSVNWAKAAIVLANGHVLFVTQTLEEIATLLDGAIVGTPAV